MLAPLLVFAVAAVVVGASQTPFIAHDDRVLNDALHAKLSAVLAKHEVVGYALALVRPSASEPVEFANWGNATEDGRPMASNSTMNLGSVSKHFAATALGLVMDDFKHGRNVTALPAGLDELTWSSKLKNVLPEWSSADRDIYEHVTLRDALSHVSGYPRHDLVYNREETTATLLAKMAHLRPARELREDWTYVNLFYMLTSEIVARYSGQPFAEFVSARVFSPVSMPASTYSFSAGEEAGTAVHWFTRAGRRLPPWITEADVAVAGAGGVVSSTQDLSRWLAFLLGRGDTHAKHALPAAVVEEAMSPQALMRGYDKLMNLSSAVTYGFGWGQRMHQGHRIVAHSGGAPGVSTSLVVFPDDGFGLALLCNSDSQQDTNLEVLALVANAVLGVVAQDVHPIQTATAHFIPKPSLKQFDGSIEPLAGTYSDAAYGVITLCARASTAAHCRAVLEDFATVSPLEDNTLYAAWPRFWSSHLRVRPATGLFDAMNLFPAGYGRNTSAFETPGEPASAVEFDIGEDGRVRGMGVRWDDFPEHTKGSVEERAQVWFRRVDA